MTLGQLVEGIREEWTIETTFDQLLSQFVEHRNRFVHGLLLEPELSMLHARGRKKLIGKLAAYFQEALLLRRVFRGASLLCMKLGATFIPPEIARQMAQFDSSDEEHINWFLAFFDYKGRKP